MNKFEKISKEEYLKNFIPNNGEKDKEVIYNDIKLPMRATRNSAGYDFFAPFDYILREGEELKIPTGIKCHINEGNFLAILPRSSYGFKYGMRLVNTCAVVDCDYCDNPNNEGHIFIKVKADKTMEFKKGEAFAQGIFLPYGLTEDDNVTEVRTGGIGSTTK